MRIRTMLQLSWLRRLTLVVLAIGVWAVLLGELAMINQAHSYTPFINNVRRAVNECKVIGRLQNEREGASDFISFNARIICNDRATSPQTGAGQQQGRP